MYQRSRSQLHYHVRRTALCADEVRSGTIRAGDVPAERQGVIMADPFTLGAIGALALTEGIKFLYTQAGALIDSWRKRREEKATDAEHPAREAKSGELAPLEQSSDLDGTVDTAQHADADMVAAKISELEQ